MHSHGRTMLSKLGFADVDRKNSRHDLACNYLGLRPEVLAATIQSALPKPLRVESAIGKLEMPITKGEGKYATTVGWVDVLARFRVSYPVAISPRIPTLNEKREGLIDEIRRQTRWADPEARVADVKGYFDWYDQASRSLPVVSREEHEADDARIKAELRKGERLVALASADHVAVVEVKIQRVGFGDLIRQLRLYNQHLEPVASKEDFGCEDPGWARLKGQGYSSGDPNGEYFASKRAEATRELRSLLRPVTIAVCDYELDAEYTKALRASGITPIRLGAGFEAFIRDQAASTEEVEEVPKI